MSSMSENYHDSTFLALGSLPSDIIRIILRVNGHTQHSLRLISPTWNIMVIDHLSHRRNHIPLKLVQFSPVFGNILRDEKINMIVAAESLTLSDVSRRVFHGWTASNSSIYQRYTFFESPATHLRVVGPSDITVLMLHLIAIELFFIPFLISIVPLAYTVILTTLLFSYLAFVWFIDRPKVHKTRFRFNLTLSRCSSIDVLRFKYLHVDSINQIRDFLDDIPITYLDIYMTELDEARRKIIVELVKTHKQRLVRIQVTKLAEKYLRELIIPLTQLGCNMEVWELCNADSNLIFGATQEFWNDFALHMSNDSRRVNVCAGKERLGYKYRLQIQTETL